jgi:hypothetical protein
MLELVKIADKIRKNQLIFRAFIEKNDFALKSYVNIFKGNAN